MACIPYSITKILDNEEFTTELDDLLSFACLAADKIQQDGAFSAICCMRLQVVL